MASISFPPLVPPATEPLRVDAVTPALPAALVADAETLPFSLAQAGPALPLPAAGATAQDPAALRPDQVIMARQLTYPAPDGGALALAWRGTVRSYAAQLASREQQARAGLVPAGLLAASQDARVQRGVDTLGTIHPDAWRFTVHARGPQEQYLSMVTGDPDQQSGRRRRARAALRLELVLADGTRVTVQADPVPGGVALELCAPNPAVLERLQALQPALELAVGRAGLSVTRWRWRDSLPASQVHARAPAPESASALPLPVFRAIAELALLLPGASPALA
ncbi:hypothetical protein NX773_09230 [Massilia solisilvae]|uniref:Flagellar hook-length control protein FliK n=1 Tax=Massilia solisilvae TaxID=1811225 RepID=A0ABT2BIQ7_9BURK|nr:hypothetical protein [Massilia solisilvae]MCS0608347.1 hypothetical protein [Massilia solisilvae]